jgi:hypothetical protein
MSNYYPYRKYSRYPLERRMSDLFRYRKYSPANVVPGA